MPTPGLRAITDDHPTPPPTPPARSGEPWTDEDYERMVGLIRDGADYVGVAEGLQRSASTIGVRVRRLLPVQERRCPADRVLVAAREHLGDPAYDWRQVMLLSEPPRPPVTPPAPIVRSGVEGLDNEDLVATAYGLLCAFRESRMGLVRELAREIGRRGLLDHLIAQRADHLLHRPGETATSHVEAWNIAASWVRDAPAWQPHAGEPGLWGSNGDYGPTEDDEEPWFGPID